jgi:hypothetical protein
MILNALSDVGGEQYLARQAKVCHVVALDLRMSQGSSTDSSACIAEWALLRRSPARLGPALRAEGRSSHVDTTNSAALLVDQSLRVVQAPMSAPAFRKARSNRPPSDHCSQCGCLWGTAHARWVLWLSPLDPTPRAFCRPRSVRVQEAWISPWRSRAPGSPATSRRADGRCEPAAIRRDCGPSARAARSSLRRLQRPPDERNRRSRPGRFAAPPLGV